MHAIVQVVLQELLIQHNMVADLALILPTHNCIQSYAIKNENFLGIAFSRGFKLNIDFLNLKRNFPRRQAISYFLL